MKVLIGGSSGLLGATLVPFLQKAGHECTRLVRNGSGGVRWDAQTYALEYPAALDDFDAVIHLGGENIVGRWTVDKKMRIKSSRINSTSALARQLADRPTPPATFIVASAIGYYGDREAEELTEDSAPGDGFLAQVCREWEAAADPARAAGIRVAHMRFGMLLSPDGGALKTMLPPFRMGLGGRIGSGQQYMSWASVDDAAHAIQHVLDTRTVEGALNVVSPEPCTNAAFTKTLGRVLSRPTVFPVPAPMARLAFGEMADALLLASQRVKPARLLDSGFTFAHPALEPALRALLDRNQ